MKLPRILTLTGGLALAAFTAHASPVAIGNNSFENLFRVSDSASVLLNNDAFMRLNGSGSGQATINGTPNQNLVNSAGTYAINSWTITALNNDGPGLGTVRGAVQDFNFSVPDGDNALAINIQRGGSGQLWESAIISQTLSTNLAASTTYTLSFDVGKSTNMFGGFDVRLRVGSTTLATFTEADFTGFVTPSNNTFTAVSFSYTSDAVPAVSGPLALEIRGGPLPGTLGGDTTTRQTLFDDLTLTAVAIPEPSSFAALAGFGMLGVAMMRRRRG